MSRNDKLMWSGFGITALGGIIQWPGAALCVLMASIRWSTQPGTGITPWVSEPLGWAVLAFMVGAAIRLMAFRVASKITPEESV